MTDFNFVSPDGSITATAKTDLINPSATSSNNFTIMHLVGDQDSAMEQTIFGALKKVATNIQNIITFAIANNLKVTMQSIGNPTKVIVPAIPLVIQLPGSVAGFAGTAAAGGIINLAWTALAGANNYVVERASNVGFTAGVVEVYNGPLLVKQLTGLTNSTQYFFRIKAKGAFTIAGGYTTATTTTLTS